MLLARDSLIELYQRLLSAYGHQHWWPADSPFEVMVGAILTQNTSWKNVEKAITNLKEAKCLDASAMQGLEHAVLADLIRPSGYYNVKAQRLKNYITWYLQAGACEGLASIDTDTLRGQLLKVNGVGPETADDILLYAFKRPVFVIDAYTRRLLARLELARGDEDYELLRQAIENALEPNVQLFNEYHALIVRHGKQGCRVVKEEVREHCLHCQVEQPLR